MNWWKNRISIQDDLAPARGRAGGRGRYPVWSAAAAVALGGPLLAGAATAATFHVGDDPGEYEDLRELSPGDGVCEVHGLPPGRCTLRAAIQESNATPEDDRIVVYGGGRFELTLGQLMISDSVTITGVGYAPIIDAQQDSRVIAICKPSIVEGCRGSGEGLHSYGPWVHIHNMTIRGGLVENRDRFSLHFAGGGGIVVGRQTSLWLTDAEVVENEAHRGGGVLVLGTLNVERSTIARNKSVKTDGDSVGGTGGGVTVWDGAATFERSLIAANEAWHGGGIANVAKDTLRIRNSTVSGNSARVLGGGLFMWPGSQSEITFATVAYNVAGGGENPFLPSGVFGGGGVFNWAGRLVLGNSILAPNFDHHFSDPREDPDRAPDCKLYGGVLVSAGNNIIGDADHCPRGSMPRGAMAHDRVGAHLNPLDPRLTALADNGGPTLTHALRRDSPAIDFVSFHVLGFFASPPYDQRGFDRPVGFGGFLTVADAGAYEAGAAPGVTIDPDPPVLPGEVIAGTRRDLVLPLPVARAFDRPLTVRAQEKDLRVSELLRTTSATAIVRVEVDEQALIGPRSLLVELGEETFEVPIAVVIAPEPPESVAVDIMPGTCPNSLTPKAGRTVQAAFLGSKDFDPSEIDPASVRLEGVAPVSHRLVDVGAPVLAEKPSCPEGVDKTLDLVLEFDRAEVLPAAGLVLPGFELSLELTAALKDGTPIRGHDAVMLTE